MKRGVKRTYAHFQFIVFPYFLYKSILQDGSVQYGIHPVAGIFSAINCLISYNNNTKYICQMSKENIMLYLSYTYCININKRPGPCPDLIVNCGCCCQADGEYKGKY